MLSRDWNLKKKYKPVAQKTKRLLYCLLGVQFVNRFTLIQDKFKTILSAKNVEPSLVKCVSFKSQINKDLSCLKG